VRDAHIVRRLQIIQIVLLARFRDRQHRVVEPLIYEWVAMFDRLRKRLE
jgi:hypothetical protein